MEGEIMRISNRLNSLFVATVPLWALTAGLAGCGHAGDAGSVADRLREQLLDAHPGAVIEIPAGQFHFDQGLIVRGERITLRGAGMDRTVLSFAGQKVGPEGLVVQGKTIRLEGFTVEDTAGDAIKVNDTDGLVIHAVQTRWTRLPASSHGAYGIYPVNSHHILIEDSQAHGATDSGVYVGASTDIVVRRNFSSENVVGIEVENSQRAEVYANTATGNTAGLLVVSLPDLPIEGRGTRVHDNIVKANNLPSFAAEGALVANVRGGTGVLVDSNKDTEIFANDITDNRTANIMVNSYWTIGNPFHKGANHKYDPYPRHISIHDNRFSGGGDDPTGADLAAVRTRLFQGGHLPNIVWDGYLPPNETVATTQPICTGAQAEPVLALDRAHSYHDAALQTEPFHCTLPALPAGSDPAQVAERVN
jgi:parallel beta-helix repeat protein